MNANSAREQVAAEAERWCIRLHEADCSKAERRRFERWCQAAPEHRLAYERAEHLWVRLGQAVQLPQVQEMPEARPVPRPRASGRWRWTLATAAAVGLLAVAGVLFLLERPLPPPQVHETALAETRRIMLPDGSAVTLDADSRITVQFAGKVRELALERGGAFFEVARDVGRPFVVTAGEGVATVLGTSFQMRRSGGRLDVVLVEGSLRLDRRARDETVVERPGLVLQPGQHAALIGDGVDWATGAADVETITAWRHGRLIFRDTPLAEAVVQVNRYSSNASLRIGAAELSKLPVNGVFRTGDLDSFVLALESTMPLRVRDEGGQRVLVGTGRPLQRQ